MYTSDIRTAENKKQEEVKKISGKRDSSAITEHVAPSYLH